jgi:hypothetical protein
MRAGLGAPGYESVLAACRWATRHARGRGLLTVSESDRGLRVAFSSASHQQEALRAAHDLGYAATADNGHGLLVTGWDPDLLAQRADRARVELRAVQVAHREVASATLTRLRDQLEAGIIDEAAAAAQVPGVDTEDPQAGRSGAEHARAAWTAVPITPLQIGTASGTLRAGLADVAATEQAILIQHHTSAAEVARNAVKLFFDYRDRHGYHDREAAGHAFADVTEGIDATSELAWGATGDGAELAHASGAHPTRSATTARWSQSRPLSPLLQSGPVQDALSDLAGVFGDSMTAGDVGARMTCTEADAITRALLVGGHRDAASVWLAGHARGDDDPDADRHLGDRFDLDTYLDGLDPRRGTADSDPREAAASRRRDEPTEHRAPAGAPPNLEQWAPVVYELAGPAVLEDPAWPRLAEAINRANEARWDVQNGLPRLVTQHEMPHRHPARELHYRLMIDCPAAMQISHAHVEADVTWASERATHTVAGHPAQLPVGQPPPGR